MAAFGINTDQTTLCDWIEKQHFELFETCSISTLSEAYLGVYANRPTSWLAVMARNAKLEMDVAIGEEENSSLVRVPAMRRSKFIAPTSLAVDLFLSTQAALSSHHWRLEDVGLTVEDYFRLLPEVKAFASGCPIKPKDLAKCLSIDSSAARALINVATYMGELVRIPSQKPWSNQWGYAPPEARFSLASQDKSVLRSKLIKKYIEQYGPVNLDDIAWWTGFAKQEVHSLVKNLDCVEIAEGMWMTCANADQFLHSSHQIKPSGGQIRFLPAWDPLLMGYSPQSKIRDYLNLNEIGAYDRSGNGKPVVFEGAKAIGCWQSKLVKSKRYMWIEQSHICKFPNLEKLHESAEAWARRIGVEYLSEVPEK
ncbi:DNA glycosylase AlkZ-like family protein [Vibrio nigripulchritudo]|uniref:DNA glycosylase AlkZ-like family protein n=1 Tax=Vibrio nigripulchritudo TaxID=28173 RepID=UPI00068B2F38|nr:crosslink repair DNA glycosylase YcaQ family protein [Vibrio nigripulchritudo]